MNKIMIACLAALSLVSVAGCKKKGGMGDMLAKQAQFADDMCKCKEHDVDCAKKVTDEMTKWGTEMAKNAKPGDAEKVSEEDTKKMMDISKKMTDCSTKAMTPDMGAAGGAGAGGGMAGSAAEPAGSGMAGSAAEPAGSAMAGSADGSAK